MVNLYSLKKEEVLKNLDSSDNGLTGIEVTERLRRYGRNKIEEKDRRTSFGILLSQFKSPLILILLFATITSFILGEEINAVIIIGIVLISSALGFYQEYKSDKALKALQKYISFKARVLRDKKKQEINVRDLVPGDIVFLNLGDIVPADLRILESEELYANESQITGESYPVEKNSFESGKSNVLFMGSEISEGFCRGIVISTGENTEFGKTANILSSREPPGNFQKGISNFGKFLVRLIFILTFFVFAANFFLGKGLFNSFLFAIALAVGVTPELLPVIMAISMSKGAIKMAEKKVVVKKLISIEDLGNMDVLCTDKTGTLTENKISLKDYFDISKKKNKDVLVYSTICNSAITHKHQVVGNVLDKTVVEYANKNKINPPKYEKIKDIKFDYQRKMMSCIVKINNKRSLICKGNTLSLLNLCSKIKINNTVKPINLFSRKIKEMYEDLSKKGFRVISVAYKEIGTKRSYTVKEENNLIFLGFLTFLDVPKKDVKKTLEKLNLLEVEVKVLTGDNELVTGEICRQVGFAVKGKILTGEELNKMNKKSFLKAVEENNVFAGLIPEQKLEIVKSLKKKGHITGFLGDGINDAAAVKYSDVGITVDSAVDVTKGGADIILLKKSLEVIAEGILEGRKTFGNSTKYIKNTISANFGNMLTLSVSSLYFNFIPLLPKQILLTNLVSDVPLLTISTDNVDKGYLKKPRKWNIKTIQKFMIFFGIISIFFDIITLVIAWFFIAPGDPEMFRTVWFTESVLSEIFITFSIRTKQPFWKSKPSRLLVFSSLIGVALVLFLSLSPFNIFFEFEKMPSFIYAIIATILLAYFIVVEIGKKIFYSKIKEE